MNQPNLLRLCLSCKIKMSLTCDRTSHVCVSLRTVATHAYLSLKARVDKTGSFGPWSRFIVYFRSVMMLPVIPYTQKVNW